jgi:hypothetical protein
VGQRSHISMSYVTSSSEREQLQATIGAWSTVLLIVIVDVLWVIAKVLVGEGQLSGVNLGIFTIGGLIIVGWLSLWAAAENVGVLLGLLARVTQMSTSECERALRGRHVSRGRFRRALSNLWIPVTCQFLLVGWLIYASGGIPDSPYLPVPVAMMIIGQSVYHVPRIELCTNPGSRDVLIFLWRVVRFYGYPQLMFVSQMIGVAVLQICEPLASRPVPIAETILTTQLSVSLGLCVAFVARRVDRAAAPGTS